MDGGMEMFMYILGYYGSSEEALLSALPPCPHGYRHCIEIDVGSLDPMHIGDTIILVSNPSFRS